MYEWRIALSMYSKDFFENGEIEVLRMQYNRNDIGYESSWLH